MGIPAAGSGGYQREQPRREEHDRLHANRASSSHGQRDGGRSRVVRHVKDEIYVFFAEREIEHLQASTQALHHLLKDQLDLLAITITLEDLAGFECVFGNLKPDLIKLIRICLLKIVLQALSWAP